MERKGRVPALFLRSWLNNYRQDVLLSQPENTIISHFQVEIADNIFSPIIMELKGRFIITSNRESGLGRYDVVMQPVDKDRDYCYVIEFKVFRRGRDESLEDCVNKALRQIEEKRYDTALVDAGIASSRIMHLGIGFDGKRVLVSSE